MAIIDVRQQQSSTNITLQAMQDVAKEEKTEHSAEQIESQQAFQASQEEAVNPFAAKFAQKEKPIKASKNRIDKMLEMREKGERLLPVDAIQDKAGDFQRQNPELNRDRLFALRQYIKPGDSKEEILRKVLEFYQDPSNADDALSFLLETTEGELYQAVKDAKEEFNKQFGREIIAGRNIAEQARQAAQKGLGTPTTMRDMYRDITGNPRDSTTLFEELSSKYAFKDLKKIVDFLLHSLGADMKSKGPSIARGLLHRLISETRNLQAILGVYRFFKIRMALVEKLFAQEGLEIPGELSFETMAKQFMALAADRYPSSARALQTAGKLGIEKWVLAKIIVLSQMRDAIREVAMNLIYKSLQHRDELYLAILEALEDLEDQLDELRNKEEEERQGKEDDDEGDDEEDKEDKKKKKK